MRKRILKIAATFILSLAILTGCGNEENTTDTTTDIVDTTTTKEDNTTTDAEEITTSSTETTEEKTTKATETDTTDKAPETAESVTTTKVPETTESVTTTKVPETTETATTTTASEEPTTTPAPSEAPIIKTIGTVDNARYNKALGAFEKIVKTMRTAGLVKNTDTCITMDNTTINVDITFDNDDIDLTLSKDNSTNIYTLKFDYDFVWIEGFSPKINGIDPAPYYKDLLNAILSMVSDDAPTLFARIDLDCFSSAGLGTSRWTEIGDCFIMSGDVVIDEYISYKITKEAKDTRDSTYVLTGTRADGKTIECVIEYDSSLVSFETVNNSSYIQTTYEISGDTVTYMGVLDDSKSGPNCYPVIRTGSTSYETYKANLLAKFTAKGDNKPSIFDYGSHKVNGYTYYWLEGSYKTADDIGDPDIVYVQIGDNEYIELYNVLFNERLEYFVNDYFYIKEVKIK